MTAVVLCTVTATNTVLNLTQRCPFTPPWCIVANGSAARIAVTSAALPGLAIRQYHIFRATRRKAISMNLDCPIGGNGMGEANAFFHPIGQTPLLLQ